MSKEIKHKEVKELINIFSSAIFLLETGCNKEDVVKHVLEKLKEVQK